MLWTWEFQGAEMFCLGLKIERDKRRSEDWESMETETMEAA